MKSTPNNLGAADGLEILVVMPKLSAAAYFSRYTARILG